MRTETRWYLGQRTKTAAPKWVKMLRKQRPGGRLFSEDLPEWAQRLSRASDEGLVADVKNRQLQSLGKGMFGEASATLYPGQQRAAVTKRFKEPSFADKRMTREEMLERAWKPQKADPNASEYGQMFGGIRRPDMAELQYNPGRAAAVEAENLRRVGELRAANPEIDKFIQVPDLLEETVSREGRPLIRMTGLDVGPGMASKRTAARAAEGLEGLRQGGIGYSDLHSGNVMFRNQAGELLERPAVLDWGLTYQDVENMPFYEMIGREFAPHAMGSPVSGGYFDENLMEALMRKGRLTASPEQLRLIEGAPMPRKGPFGWGSRIPAPEGPVPRLFPTRDIEMASVPEILGYSDVPALPAAPPPSRWVKGRYPKRPFSEVGLLGRLGMGTEKRQRVGDWLEGLGGLFGGG